MADNVETMLIARPCKHADVTAFALDDELVVYDSRTGQSYVLNHTGSIIWFLCDGTHTIDELAQEITATFGVSITHAQQDVASLVHELTRSGLISAV